MVDPELRFLAASAVRQGDLNAALIIQASGLIRDTEIKDMDLRPVRQKDRFPRHAALVRHRRGIECQCPEHHRQQNGQMRDKGPVMPEAVLSVNGSSAEILPPAAHLLETGPQLLHPLGRQEDRVLHFGRPGGLAFYRPHHTADADQGAETEVQAKQHQQGLEVPAVKYSVQLKRQDRPVQRGVILRIPGDLPVLRDQRSRNRAGGDQAEQEDAEAHRAQRLKYFPMSISPFEKSCLLSYGRQLAYITDAVRLSEPRG